MEIKLWGFELVSQVQVKDIELVPLHHFGRRIVCVVVSLIVFVPLEAGFYRVEVSGLQRLELVTQTELSGFRLNRQVCEFLLILTKALLLHLMIQLESFCV